MNLSWMAHYKNKYPGGRVHSSDDCFDVYSESGEHVLAMRKNGAGQWVCVSEEHGLRDRHDLAPIPKESRVHKVQNGKLGFDEKSEERMKSREKFLCPDRKDVVLSCEDLKKSMKFDEKQKLTE